MNFQATILSILFSSIPNFQFQRNYFMSEEDGDHTQVTKAHFHVLLISRFAVPPTKKGSLP